MKSDYHIRKENRIKRLRERAEKARQDSASANDQLSKIAEVIPLGQPILRGHYSERWHRRDIDKIRSLSDKSVDMANKAKGLDYRANAAESNRAISSDNPDAIELLQEKIDKMEATRNRMKKANAEYRKHKGDVNKMTCLTETEMKILKIEIPKRMEYEKKAIFQPYQLQNLGGRIKAAKDRLELLRKQESDVTAEIAFPGGRIVDNVDDNRVQIFHDQIPTVEVRAKLKERGFKWARSIECWQRQRNKLALCYAKMIVGIIEDKS